MKVNVLFLNFTPISLHMSCQRDDHELRGAFKAQLLGARSCVNHQRASSLVVTERTSTLKDETVKRSASCLSPPIRVQNSVACHDILFCSDSTRWPCPPRVSLELFLNEAVRALKPLDEKAYYLMYVYALCPPFTQTHDNHSCNVQ